MIIVMQKGASKKEIHDAEKEIVTMGYKAHPIHGVERTVIGAIGDERGKARLQEALETLPGVERVIPILKPYKLAGLELHKEKTHVRVGGAVFGGKRVQVIAGPCTVESLDQICDTADAVKKAGAAVLRGGAYKPRTSPYSFQGLEEEGLRLLDAAKARSGLPVVTEVMKESVLEVAARHADMIQIGARNMQNYDLLKAVGQIRTPVLLKRGMASTIHEWLMAAEYIMSQGNMQVVLCERGIRTFETATRNTLDLNAVAVLKRESHLPVVVDPSHGTGHWEYVEDMALAAVAAGADGIMVEVHPNPHEAWSDGSQSLTPDKFARLMAKLRKVAVAVGRDL